MAVFTPVSESDLKAFLAGYDLPGEFSRSEGIMQGVENTNYHLFTTGGRFILTLYEKRTSPEALPFVFAFMEHLNGKGIPCPRILPDRKGEKIGTLAGKPATIQSFLEGSGVAPGEMSPAQCRAMGIMTARMHLAGAEMPLRRANPMGLPVWKALFEKTKDRADEVSPDLAKLISGQLKAIERDLPDGMAQGAIHADLFPDNVFFRGGTLSGIIDFGFSCTDLLAYDLAIVVNAWCFDAGNAFVPENFRALIQGYESLRPLSGTERAALPLLCRAGALRILMTRLHDWLFHPGDGFVKPKRPDEYVEKLEFHIASNLFEVESV